MGDASVGVRGEGSPSGGGTIFDELEAVGGLFTTEDIRAGKLVEISRGAMFKGVAREHKSCVWGKGESDGGQL